MSSLITFRNFKYFIALSAMALLGGLAQHTDSFQLLGIKVNFVFAVLGIAPLFLETISWYMLLVLPTLFLVSVPTPITFEAAVIGGLAAVLFYLNRWLRWRTFLNGCVLITVGIILFYGIINPAFLETHGGTVALEIGYTIAVGGIAYLIIRRL